MNRPILPRQQPEAEDKANMTSNNHFGSLSILPPEVRLVVWSYFLPCASGGPRSELGISSLGILRANHAVYNEVSAHIYDALALEIHVQPEYDGDHWLLISTSSGASWALKNLDDALKQGFGNLPYHKLKELRVLIEAPKANDPGQLISLWKKCLDAAHLFEGRWTHGLCNLEIVLVDGISAKWCGAAGVPQRTFEGNSDLYPWFGHGDWSKVLTAFYCVRGAKSASIRAPDDLVVALKQGQILLLRNLEVLFERRQPINDMEHHWAEVVLEEEKDELFMVMEDLLDDVPGPTAAQLRLDRCRSWYENGSPLYGSPYEANMERIFRTVDLADPLEHEFKLCKRFTSMKANNPGSLVRIYGPFSSWSYENCYFFYPRSAHRCFLTKPEYPFANDNTILDAYRNGDIMDGWLGDDAWTHDFPNGIPSPAESIRRGRPPYENDDLPPEYHEKFNRKVRRWMGYSNTASFDYSE